MGADLSIIELAARRIEELRRSGIEVPVRPRPSPEGAVAREGAPKATQAVMEPRASRAPQGAARTDVELATPRPKSAAKVVRIDFERLAAMQYVDPATPQSQIANEFRVVKRPLLLGVASNTAATERSNLIMVTSSVPGEGKTFVAVNLAISLAMEVDRTVLLVDADVARPSVLSRLGLPPSDGLLDLLSNPSLDFSDVLLRTNIDKLSILPPGSQQARATELLASDGMRRLLDEMAGRYPDRIIVFDAPPLLPSPEARVLATHMGQVIVVVEADRTPEKSLLQALATVESCPRVLPLLNKVARSEVGSYYANYAQGKG